MKLELTFFGALCTTALCATNKFTINDITASSGDFGDKYDYSPEEADDYGCGNMQFTRKEPSSAILTKYNVTKEEYNEIAEKLEEGLSFGNCGWCI